MKTKILSCLGFFLLYAVMFAGKAMAAEGTTVSLDKGLTAIGIGLAVGLGALGTGLAQSRIGPAGLGSAAEKPEMQGLALIFLLLPETLVIFGLVVAFMLIGRL
jgi:V/A-type H+/Na+-transporting ATPase subunit K